MFDLNNSSVAETADQAEALLKAPLLDLLHQSADVHRAHHDVTDIQKASLLSVKTGGCPED